jgi:hydroxymethylpyrimidine/phosphomethylpyrimidine kinase
MIRDVVAPLARLPVVADDDNLPAGELEHRRVNPREPELEHAPGRLPEQLDDPRSRGSGESRRHSTHPVTLTFEHRGAARAAEITPVEPDPGHAGEGSALVPRCLTIAGSDSGGGAGIQADLKAFAAAGAHGSTAIVALTAQNTVGVDAVFELPPAFVLAQLNAVWDDIGVDAAKTGMLFSRAIVDAVADWLEERPVPLVVDPVMVASSGARLLEEDAVAALVARIFPLATVVTPNLPEAQALTASNSLLQAELAEMLLELGAPAAIVTGGHAEEPVDHLFDGVTHYDIPVVRHDIAATHGAGCTHSATLAALLARGESLLDAARGAAAAASRAVAAGLVDIGAGDGPVNVLGVDQ